MVGFGKFLKEQSRQHGVAQQAFDYHKLKLVLSDAIDAEDDDEAALIFRAGLEQELNRVNAVVKQKLKVLQRVRKALDAARAVREYKLSQEQGIVLMQLSNVYDDVILVLWFMYLSSVATSKIVKKYNKNVPDHKYIVDPTRWMFLSAGLSHAQKAKASIEAEFGACLETAGGANENTILERSNSEVNELAKSMKSLMQNYRHHLYRHGDPTDWAVKPALEPKSAQRKPRQSTFIWDKQDQSHVLTDVRIRQAYNPGPVVGRGAYGVVCRATSKATGVVFAIKTIHDAWSHPILGQRTFREIAILQQLRHENIISLVDVVVNRNRKDVHLVMPFIPHTCEALLNRRSLLLQHKKWFTLQLLSAVAYCHARGVVHRDLKLSNILVDDTPSVYLSDFGLARTLASGDETTTNDNPDYVQTQWYRAPEVLLCWNKTTPAADMWSMGCIVAELLTGVPLFPGQDTQHQLELILGCCPIPASSDLLKGVAQCFPQLTPNPAAELNGGSNGHGNGRRHSSPASPTDEQAQLLATATGREGKDGRQKSGSLLTRRNLADVVEGCCKSGVQDDFPRADAVALLARLLQFEPSDRVSAKDAMHDEWFLSDLDVRRPVLDAVIRSARPYAGEEDVVLKLSCTELHPIASYLQATEQMNIPLSRREQDANVRRNRAATLVQQFFLWRRRGGPRPAPGQLPTRRRRRIVSSAFQTTPAKPDLPPLRVTPESTATRRGDAENSSWVCDGLNAQEYQCGCAIL
ncbi:Extracellular signal-regulated kinase 2 [Diplonema papillatum]|nr:Extracellular signal-regulated kinase 2 [Diplonema papillatum]